MVTNNNMLASSMKHVVNNLAVHCVRALPSEITLFFATVENTNCEKSENNM